MDVVKVIDLHLFLFAGAKVVCVTRGTIPSLPVSSDIAKSPAREPEEAYMVSGEGGVTAPPNPLSPISGSHLSLSLNQHAIPVHTATQQQP